MTSLAKARRDVAIARLRELQARLAGAKEVARARAEKFCADNIPPGSILPKSAVEDMVARTTLEHVVEELERSLGSVLDIYLDPPARSTRRKAA